ncbi:MAG TPA: malonyl-ACP O-methyltransferase BioC [Methylotenera sp.]|nr:malonyl-ACP O-methyltransferase BioC [Methylotenera sp.]
MDQAMRAAPLDEAQDEYRIDKARMRTSFSSAADSYDAAAVLQKKVREEMLDRLSLINIAPQAILDAGCGTGLGGFALQKKFKSAQLVSLDIAFKMLQKTAELRPFMQKILHKEKLVCADIENLPIASQSINLLWSSLALQWCNDLDVAFNEAARILQADGLFIFSTFGPDTLKELRVASSNGHTHVSRFIDMHDIGDALTRAGFSAPVLDVEHYTLTYDDVKGVMRDLKSIGAHNATQGRARGLQGKGFLQNLTQNYEQFRTQGKLPATFEVIYGHAWKPVSTRPAGQEFSPITFKKHEKSS